MPPTHWRSPLRWGAAILTVATLALGTGTVQAAAPAAGSVYVGTASNSDKITLTLDASAPTLTFRVDANGLDGCTGVDGATGIPVRTNPDGFFATSTAARPSGATAVGWAGYFGDAGVAAGAWGDLIPIAPGRCNGAHETWVTSVAGTDAQKGPGLTPNGIYTGSVTSVLPNVGVKGSLTLRANAAGTGFTSVEVTYTDSGCTYPLNLNDISLTDGKTFRTGVRTPVNNAPSASIAGVTLGLTRLGGGVSHPGTSSCPPIAAPWYAALTSTAPTPTPAPSASTTPTATAAAPGASGSTPRVNGSIPAAGGIGLVVFSGGTSAQLVTASGCPAASAAFWADDGAGGFVTYIPGAAVAVVNAGWDAKFPNGVPANTALIGRCR